MSLTIAVCGEPTATGLALAINGTIAKRGLVPWHAVIYSLSTKPGEEYDQICGGTILNNHLVISGIDPSAYIHIHCLTNTC
jgi:hypothetical protein